MKISLLFTEKIIFPICFIAIILWHFYCLTDYPMYFPDDAMVGSKVKTMIEKGSSIGTLEYAAYKEVKDIEKIFSQIGYILSTLPPYFFGEITLFTVRFVNLFFIAALVLLVYFVSKEIKDWRLGIISIVILSFSNLFAYGSHIARLDIVSAIFGLLAILIFQKNKKENPTVDFVTGAILIFALNFHLRIVLFIPIISMLYLNRYGFKAIKSKNAWSFAFGVLITGAAYYLINVLPYQEQQKAMLKMTVGNSRSMPLLSLDYQQFGICLREIFKILQKENFIFLTVFVEFGLCLIFYRSLFLTTLLAATLFFTPAIMRDFYEFNAIIIFPLLCIGAASFFHRFLSNKYLTVLLFILFFNFLSLSTYKIKFAVNNGCNTEFEKNSSTIASLVSSNDVLMGVDSYWFFFQNYKYHSWLLLKFLGRYYDWNLEQVFKFIKPDYFIADGRFFYFTRKTKGPTDWYNSYRIDRDEFDNVIKKYSKEVWSQENTCNGRLVLYKFNWDVDGSQNNN